MNYTPDYRRAIASKLLNLSDEELRILLLDVNAIAAGVEISNSELLKHKNQAQILAARTKLLQDENLKLQERIKELERQNAILIRRESMPKL